MYERDRYLTAVAKRVSEWCSKPLVVIAALVLLFVWMTLMPFLGLPVKAFLVVNTALFLVILLLVLILQDNHKQDIRSLQARLDALVAEQRDRLRAAHIEDLSEAELLQVRDLLKRQANGNQEADRRARRDSRPSLF